MAGQAGITSRPGPYSHQEPPALLTVLTFPRLLLIQVTPYSHGSGSKCSVYFKPLIHTSIQKDLKTGKWEVTDAELARCSESTLSGEEGQHAT